MIRSQAILSVRLTALLALLLPRALTAADSAQALQLLERGRTLLSDHLLLRAKASFTACLREEPENEVCGYSFAKTSLYLAEAYRSEGRTKDAEEVLDAGIEQLQRTLAHKETAEAHSLLADLYGQYIALHGGFSGMRYGPKVAAENKRALEVDRNNAKAYASLGRQYFNTPAKVFCAVIVREEIANDCSITHCCILIRFLDYPILRCDGDRIGVIAAIRLPVGRIRK